jgi:hypothetical protein
MKFFVIRLIWLHRAHGTKACIAAPLCHRIVANQSSDKQNYKKNGMLEHGSKSSANVKKRNPKLTSGLSHKYFQLVNYIPND